MFYLLGRCQNGQFYRCQFGIQLKPMRATRDDLLREGKHYKFPRRGSNLLRAVEERLSAEANKDEVSALSEIKRGSQVVHLPIDLIFKILLLLPAESLHKASFVCKAWFNLINSSNFVEDHLCQCESVLIYRQSVSQRRLDTFSVEAKFGQSEEWSMFSRGERPKYYINFLEVKDGKGKVCESKISGIKNILASCNGLILATCQQNRGLLVMNPVTRKVIILPLGTLLQRDESYGFAFCPLTREYKVVHLFRDESGHIGCEILNLGMRLWQAVDGPSFGLFRKFCYKPVAAIGALHWLPSKQGSNYLVYMGMDDEKFHSRTLPNSSGINDRLVEIGGSLGFVTHVALDRTEVWILKGLVGGDWLKLHVITSCKIVDLIPLSTLWYGREMIFKGRGDSSFHVYNFEIEVMREVEKEGEENYYHHHSSYLPHVHSLATWESLQSIW
ncbi:hypothetical protein NMG60_11000960 [Bertholletia excelsa]